MVDRVQSQSSFAGVILRLFWFLAGNLILFITGIRISQSASFAFLDLIFWGTVAAMLVARFADIRFFGGQTADGAAATLADWRGYALKLSAVALGLWLVVHLLARLA